MRISVPPHAVVAAGSTSSFCSASLGGSDLRLHTRHVCSPSLPTRKDIPIGVSCRRVCTALCHTCGRRVLGGDKVVL